MAMIIEASTDQLLELNRTVLVFSAGFVDHRIGSESFLRLLSSSRTRAFGVMPAVVRSRFPRERLRGLVRLAEKEGKTLLIVKDWTGAERELASHLVQEGVSAFPLTHTVLKAALPINVQLYLDPEVPERLGPIASAAGELAKEIRRMMRLRSPEGETGEGEGGIGERKVALLASLRLLNDELRRILPELGMRRRFVKLDAGEICVSICGKRRAFRIEDDVWSSLESMLRALSVKAGDFETEAALIEAVDKAIAEGPSVVPFPVGAAALVTPKDVRLVLTLGGAVMNDMILTSVGGEGSLRDALLRLLGWEGDAPEGVFSEVEKAASAIWSAYRQPIHVWETRTVALGTLRAKVIVSLERASFSVRIEERERDEPPVF